MKKLFAKAYVKGVKENGGLVGAIGSTGATDRDGEILSPEGWKTENFKRNPVLLWSHNAMELPVGKVTSFEIKDGALVFDAEFAEKENDFAKKVADLYRGGFLNAFSVGFMPSQKDGDTYTDLELLEISCVNVPANPEALAAGVKSMMDDVEKMAREKATKSPACRMADEAEDDCVSRKVKELVDEGMPQDQAIAAAKNMCSKSCDEKGCKVTEKTGRVLSEKNRSLIKNAVETMKQAINALEELVQATEPGEESKGAIKGRPRRAKRDSKVLQALRIIDRATEAAIHTVKEQDD